MGLIISWAHLVYYSAGKVLAAICFAFDLIGLLDLSAQKSEPKSLVAQEEFDPF